MNDQMQANTLIEQGKSCVASGDSDDSGRLTVAFGSHAGDRTTSSEMSSYTNIV